ERRLGAGAGPGYVVAQLGKRVAQGYLGGEAGDRVAGSLGSQGRRAGKAGIDLDHRQLARLLVERELAVAASAHVEGAHDVESRRAQALVVVVGEGLAGSHHD